MTNDPTGRAMHFVHANWMLLDMKAECMACDGYRPKGVRKPHQYSAPEAMVLAVDDLRAAALAAVTRDYGIG